MNESQVAKIMRMIEKSTDNTMVQKQLVKLRIHLVKNDEGIRIFYRSRSIPVVCKLLDVLNQQILEVTLSILANCCTNESCRSEAIQCGVVKKLIPILSIQNTTILNRAYRLMGNLAFNQTAAKALYSASASFFLTKALSEQENNTVVLIQMVRVIRQLWSLKEFKNEVTSQNGIEIIMALLKKTLKDKNAVNPQERRSSVEFVEDSVDVPSNPSKLTDTEIDVEEVVTKKNSFKIPSDPIETDLLNGILKFISELAPTITFEMAEQLYEDGCESLIFLASEKSKFRSYVLKILVTLSWNDWAKKVLNAHNLVLHAAKLLSNNTNLEVPLSHNEQRCCLIIVCLACENACDRNKLKRNGFLNLLVNAIRNSTCQKEIALVIHSLYQFRFDNMGGLWTLIGQGMINALIKVVEDITKQKSVDHITFAKAEKDESSSEPKERTKHEKRHARYIRSSSPSMPRSKYRRIDYYDPDSPSSSGYGSNFQRSPSWSSGYSPFSSPSRSNDEDDFDSDTYSPVYSDCEEETQDKDQNESDTAETKTEFNLLSLIYDNKPVETEKTEEPCEDDCTEVIDLDENSCLTISELGENTETERPSRKSEESDTENIKISNSNTELIAKDPLPYILTILWKVTIQSNTAPDFVRVQNLNTLLNVCYLVKQPQGRIYQILENIMVHIQNFVAILKQDFIFNVYKLKYFNYNHTSCYSCSKMKAVAENLLLAYGTVGQSGYGRGEIEHFLLTGDDKMKKRVAIVLLFIIHAPDVLNKFLFYCNALEIVFNEIFNGAKEGEEDLAVEASNGITSLALNLKIYSSAERELRKSTVQDYDDQKHQELLKSLGANLVKFVIDDGYLMFDKDILMKVSDVFESMFRNDFRESQMNEVHLKEISLDGLKYFFHLILLQYKKELKKVAPKINNMAHILEAYQLASKYMITNVQKSLLNTVKVCIDHTNVLLVFERSMKYVNNELLETSIYYYLNSEISGEKKLKIFREASKSEFSKQWKQMIVDTISMKCKPYGE